jgi:hypothetical protein
VAGRKLHHCSRAGKSFRAKKGKQENHNQKYDKDVHSTSLWIVLQSQKSSYLQAAGEADEVRTETEASALASRHTDGRGDEVKHGEDGRGDEGERGDFIEGEGLAGDEDGRTSNDEAFDQILDSTVDNFRDVHCSYIQN